MLRVLDWFTAGLPPANVSQWESNGVYPPTACLFLWSNEDWSVVFLEAADVVLYRLKTMEVIKSSSGAQPANILDHAFISFALHNVLVY